MSKFNCSGCGCCCKRLNKVSDTLTIGFPYKWDNNGVCEMLVDNKCLVYDNRPLICNVDKLHQFSNLPKKEYYKLNNEYCNQMMDEDGIDKSYRI